VTGISSRGMAWRAALDIPDGAVVNLGIGLPERVANYLPEDREIIIHSENGIFGMGPAAGPADTDYDLINAGKKPVTLVPGGAFVHHAESFAAVRGGHIDICILGAFQVSAHGDIANWSGEDANLPPAVGGAMDLAQGARSIRVLMTHTNRDGSPKIVQACTLPLTAPRVVKRVYTDLAVIDVEPDGLLVREIAEGCSFADLQARTGAPLRLTGKPAALRTPV
jgi:3-oxoadipate CoA-transferase beta subunit